MKINKVKRIISSLLLVMLGVYPFSITNSYAARNIKTMTVEFEEQLDCQSRSKTVTIPNLINVVNVKTNTGNVTHTISDDKVTINVSGGSTSKNVNNPTKYSKQVTDHSTSSNNSFSSTKSYSKNGYSGHLRKDGSSRVTNGSYTASQSKSVTETRTSQDSDTIPDSVSYNSEGYKGVLTKDGVLSHDIKTDWQFISKYWTEKRKCIENYERITGTFPHRTRIYYEYDGYNGANKRPWQYYRCEYEEIIVSEEYTQSYKGKVTKPASDTRIWQQDYFGTVYKSGIDNYYKYKVIIEYIDNSIPTLEITTPKGNRYFGKNQVIKLSGTVNDPDSNQNITISATIGGKKKTTIVTTPSNNKPWILSWSSNDLDEGTYSNIVVTANDGVGDNVNQTYTRKIFIDKTIPSTPTITLNNNNWTKEDVTVTIVHGSESSVAYQSGVQKSQYKIGNGSWTSYISPFTVKNEGTTKIYARTIDKVGNISREASKEIKIDKRKPKLKIIVGN